MQQIKKAVKAAFPYTIPVLTGYLFMGIAFGILLESRGYGAGWALLMAVVIYAGSGQFLAVEIMAAGFNPLLAFGMTLMINARYAFYGISMLEKFKMFGKEKWYMIFTLTDETFALLTSAKPPSDVPEKNFYIAISALNNFYWIAGCTLGGLIGSSMSINTKGIDFVMTALFVVILMEQWQIKQNRVPAMLGIGCTILCMVFFGNQWFVLAAMALLLLVFTAAKKPIERGMQSNDNS